MKTKLITYHVPGKPAATLNRDEFAATLRRVRAAASDAGLLVREERVRSHRRAGVFVTGYIVTDASGVRAGVALYAIES